MKSNLLLVFCKNPQKGKVKTRLAKSIGDDKALLIYEKLLEKTAVVLSQLSCDIALYYSENIPEQDCFKHLKATTKQQVGDDLGKRMANAFQAGLNTHQKVVIIGTDLWTLEIKTSKSFCCVKPKYCSTRPRSRWRILPFGLKALFPVFLQTKLGEQVRF